MDNQEIFKGQLTETEHSAVELNKEQLEYKIMTLIEKYLEKKLKEEINKSTCTSSHHRRAPCGERCVLANAGQTSGWSKMKSSLPIPENAVIAGYLENGSLIYVGRATHDREVLVGKALQRDHKIFYGASGVEHGRTEYEILTGRNYAWLPWHLGSVPSNAVLGGNTQNGEKLYIGRGLADGELAVGYVRPSHHCLYVSVKGKIHSLRSYDVLVHLTPDEATLLWLSGREKWLDKNVIPIADDSTNSYVGHAFHEGDLLPALVNGDKNRAYIPRKGKVIEKSEFELLTGDGFCWEPASNGRVPLCAIAGGRTKHGEPLYIGRKLYSGEMRMGSVQQSHGCMYMIVGDRELPVKNYEVLVCIEHVCTSCPNE